MQINAFLVAAAAAVFFLPATTVALENGVARTPPMGWLSWQRYRCHMNCTEDPDNCFSEKLIKKIIDEMASGGWKEAGYEYVNLDDCEHNTGHPPHQPPTHTRSSSRILPGSSQLAPRVGPIIDAPPRCCPPLTQAGRRKSA